MLESGSDIMVTLFSETGLECFFHASIFWIKFVKFVYYSVNIRYDSPMNIFELASFYFGRFLIIDLVLSLSYVLFLFQIYLSWIWFILTMFSNVIGIKLFRILFGNLNAYGICSDVSHFGQLSFVISFYFLP